MTKTTPKSLTISHVYTKLSERVSTYNARLMLRSAIVTSGVLHTKEDQELDVEQARALCLALINKGGPAFQVGSDLYRIIQ